MPGAIGVVILGLIILIFLLCLVWAALRANSYEPHYHDRPGPDD